MEIEATTAPVPSSSHIFGTKGATRARSVSTTLLALAVVLMAAAGLRLYALNWDDGRDLHPDELYVAKNVLIQRIFITWPLDLDNVLDPDRSGLNPRSVDPNMGEPREYPYGALPLLVTDTVATALGWITGDNWNAADRAYLVGRALSALLDTLTVGVVYLIGARVFTPRIGLFAALFAALAPISIQLAHFFTTDSWLTFFVALTLYLSIRAAETGAGRWFAAAGAGFGLAMATKGSVFALAGLIGAAILYDIWRRWQREGSVPEALLAVPRQVGLAAIFALVGFALFEPYALVRPGIFLQSLRTQAAIVSGTFDIPFTRIFVGTTPVVYQVEQFVRWGFGPVAGVLALVGVLTLGQRFWRERSAGTWLLLCWLVGYGVVIAVPETKFLRYLAPLVPALALTAALCLDAVITLVQRRIGDRAAAIGFSLLLVGAALWTAAFMSIYAVEHPRLAASRWIFDNVPPGSTLSWEYWDDRLPKPLGPGLNEEDFQYQFLNVDLYADRPPVEVADYLYETLDQLDYAISSSDRISAAIVRSPWRYPVQIRFLDLLRTGQLGFTPVAEFHVTPGLGPIRVDDRTADESFINYDHPRVSIFAKDQLIPRADYDLLMANALEQPWSPTRYDVEPALLLDQPVGDLPIVADARWSDAVTSNTGMALLAWIGLMLVLQAAAWPLTRFIFARFGDAGWGLSRSLTLIIVGYVVWVGASLRWFEFRAPVAWLTIGVLAIGLWLTRRRFAVNVTKQQRQAAIASEVVFWSVFGVFLLFRFLNPDGWHPIWGGEKPMEFAHLNATLRSANFPPIDPWYAGGYLNYYYYGLYLIALLLKLTGIPAEIGFNLAQPTMIALLAAAGFSVAATLGRDLTRRTRLAIPAGLVGVVLLIAIGNLTSLGRLLSANQQDFGSFLDWVWAGSRAIQAGITEFPFFTALYADLHAHVVALPITVLAIALSYTVARDGRSVLRDWSSGPDRTALARFAAQFLVLALVLGTLFPTNAWDLPAYAALAVAALIMASMALPDWRLRLVWVGTCALALGTIAYVLFLPFHSHYVALFGSVELVREPTPFTEATSHIGALVTVALLGLVSLAVPRRRDVAWPISQPGLVVAALAFGLLLANLAQREEPAVAGAVQAVLLVAIAAVVAVVLWTLVGGLARTTAQYWFIVAVEVFFLAAVIGALALGQPVLAGYLMVAALAAGLWIAGKTVSGRFAPLLVLAAASIGAGVEVIFIADDLVGTTAYRMNTIFKFYNQIWVLLAIGGAALIVRMARDSRWLNRGPRGDGANPQPIRGAVQAGWARAGLIVSGVLVAGSMLYPLFAVQPRLAQRFEQGTRLTGSLNALDWMENGTLAVVGGEPGQRLTFDEDRAVINWFNQNVRGSPVIAEASIGPYRCNGSRISIGTGLPTIIGWERHEQQQRDPTHLPRRVADVRALYTAPTATEKLVIIHTYDVEYIVVGDLERDYITPNGNDCFAADPIATTVGIAALEDMVGTYLEVAFQAGDTVVYGVLPLGSSPSPGPIEVNE